MHSVTANQSDDIVICATMHEEICRELNETYVKKNTDYGDAFNESIEEYGLIASLVRMNDKMKRIKQLVLSGKSEVSESLEDSLLDLANYAIMTVMSINMHKKK